MKSLIPASQLTLLLLLISCADPPPRKYTPGHPEDPTVIFLDQYGDTINKVDDQNQRQGKWMIYSNEGNERSISKPNTLSDEGYYKDGLKEGYWKMYSEHGDVDSILYIHGVQQIDPGKTYVIH